MNIYEVKDQHGEKNTSLDRSSPSSLRIAVVGLGGIGSAFAFQLARVGLHDITAVVRPNSLRLEQLQRDNGVVDTNGRHAPLRPAAQLAEDVPYDFVIVTMPAHRVDAILPELKRSLAKHILFMFNVFEPERFRDAVGAERCSFGMPFIQAFIDEHGKLHATIGAGGQKCKIDDSRLVDVFIASGLPAVLEPNMLRSRSRPVGACALGSDRLHQMA